MKSLARRVLKKMNSNPSKQKLEPLEYDPLKTPTSIRLLQVLPSAGDTIKCTLETFDLAGPDAPTFDALSYTWGDPISLRERPFNISTLGDVHDVVEAELARANDENDPNKRGLLLNLEVHNYWTSHPYMPYEKVAWNAERSCKIECNGSQVLGTRNLIQVLKYLRRLYSGDVRCPKDAFQQMLGHAPSRYIWIDALCINQEDVAERNAQVAIMHRIYSAAKTVIAWLGPEDGLSRLGCHVFGLLSVPILNGTLDMENLDFLSSFKRVGEVEWVALFGVLQRLWFRRAWIVQEAVLAESIAVVCGGVMFPWFAIETVCSFLAEHGIKDKIANLLVMFMREDAIVQTKPFLGDSQKLPDGIPLLEEWRAYLTVDPDGVYKFVAGIEAARRRLGKRFVEPGVGDEDRESSGAQNHDIVISDGVIEAETNGVIHANDSISPISLEELLFRFRQCDATDPRDKVYALLNIARAGRVQSDGVADQLVIDYAAPVSQVYTDATTSIIKASGELSILSQVQDPSLSQAPDLPSWVPDFSVGSKTMVFGYPGQSTFTAAGAESESAGDILELLSGNSLHPEGIKLGSIMALADLEGHDLVRTAQVCLGAPKWYGKEHSGIITAELYGDDDAASEDQSLKPPSSFCVYKKPSTKTPPKRSISTIEAFWRTLVADSFDGHHPAGLDCGFAFSDWICSAIHAVKSLILLDKKMHHPIRSEKVHLLLELEKAWEILCTTEQEGRFLLPGERAIADMNLRDAVILPAELEIDGRSTVRFVPDQERLDSFPHSVHLTDLVHGLGGREQYVPMGLEENLLPRGPVEPLDKARLDRFEKKMAAVERGHRLFRTEVGDFGMGPLSAAVEDEVWILRGAKVPFVLRRKKKGEDFKFRVVGEAYVHGYMHGERLTSEGLAPSFEKIELI